MRTRKLRGPRRKMSMPFEQFRTHTQPVNVADLEARFAAGAEVTPESLASRRAGQAPPPGEGAGAGRADQEAHVHAHAFSASAKEKIEKAGGSVEVVVAGPGAGRDPESGEDSAE